MQPSRVYVKICGIKTEEEARICCSAGADALGFVFAEGKRQISPQQGKKLSSNLPLYIYRVGVFVNAASSEVLEIARSMRLDVLQFHGDETPGYCRYFQRQGYKVIKALRVKDSSSIACAPQYSFLEAILLDGAEPGSGCLFNWELIKPVKKLEVPLVIAGGLNPENISAAITQVKPYAVDVSSGVESNGQKDPEKVIKFLKETWRWKNFASRS